MSIIPGYIPSNEELMNPKLLNENQRKYILREILPPLVLKEVGNQLKKIAVAKAKLILKNTGFDINSTDKIYFITLSFNTDDVEKINKSFNKLLNLDYIKNTNYIYSYEQRGESIDDIKGVHIHLIMDKKKGDSYKKSKIITRFYLSLKSIISKNCIDVREYPSEYRLDKVKYIKGQKEDPEKLLKVSIDPIFRIKNNLKDIYFENRIEENKYINI